MQSSRACWRRQTRRLIDLNLLVTLYVAERLNNAARPLDFDARRDRIVAQTKVRSRIAARKIASRRRHRDPLRSLAGNQFDHSANPIPVTLMTDEAQSDPMVR